MKTFYDIIDQHSARLFESVWKPILPSYADFLREFNSLCDHPRKVSWFVEHDFSAPHYYLAQPITNFHGPKPIWHLELGKLVKLADPTGDHVLPPRTITPRTITPRTIVALDFLLILSSVGVIWDMTNGPSDGASTEVCFANTLGIKVLMVTNIGQRISAFAKARCNDEVTPDVLLQTIKTRPFCVAEV